MVLPTNKTAKASKTPAPVVKQAPDDARGRTPTRGAQPAFGSAVAYTGARGQGFGLSTGGGAGSIPYHAAKAAMMALTKALAKELAQDGVTVNTVAPGIIETEFHDRHTRPELRDEWIRTLIPMQRAGLPHEVASVVAFLASDDASYMTGSTVDVNGGMAMY